MNMRLLQFTGLEDGCNFIYEVSGVINLRVFLSGALIFLFGLIAKKRYYEKN